MCSYGWRCRYFGVQDDSSDRQHGRYSQWNREEIGTENYCSGNFQTWSKGWLTTKQCCSLMLGRDMILCQQFIKKVRIWQKKLLFGAQDEIKILYIKTVLQNLLPDFVNATLRIINGLIIQLYVNLCLRCF